jgi:hypothetical protein
MLRIHRIKGKIAPPQDEDSSSQDAVLSESITELIKTTSTAVTQEDRLALSALWDVTHSRLDLYHQIATAQARRSFITAQTSIAVGFLLLITFAVLSVRSHSAVGAATTAALGAVSAALAGYISRTFIRSQEASAIDLRAYFDQPLEFSRFLAAERLLANQEDLSSDQKAMILTALTDNMVSSKPARPTRASRKKKPVSS